MSKHSLKGDHSILLSQPSVTKSPDWRVPEIRWPAAGEVHDQYDSVLLLLTQLHRACSRSGMMRRPSRTQFNGNREMQMTEMERLLIERACERLVTQFHIFADRFDHDAMASLFADDAVIDHIYLGKIEGLPAIKAYWDSKEVTSLTRHITTNIAIDVLDENRACGRS
jgi:hypothetical protein